MATKPQPKKIIMIRISPDLAQAVRERAATERRTMNAVVSYAIQQYLEEKPDGESAKKRTAR
jgi:hypothetical protein